MERPHVLILWDATLGRTRSRAARIMHSGVYLVSALALVSGCATHSLIPAAQSDAIREREKALASRSDAIQAAIHQSGKAGALAFLETKDNHLVSLPAHSPAHALARYVASAEGETSIA